MTWAQRLLTIVTAHPLEYGSNRFGLTVSAGVACWQAGSKRAARVLLEQADQARYRAQTKGRNRLEIEEGMG